jgi:1-pyrroline-5-carboxylate dehydrogenase
MGNTVCGSPRRRRAVGYWIMKLLQEAGLPAGVINFVPGHGPPDRRPRLAHPDLAGVHFTGSTGVFQGMWKSIGEQHRRYKAYPRIVGETGGKDFIFAHASADVEALVTALVRGAFEYQGQKCSAASRAYIPKSMWPQVRDAPRRGAAQHQDGRPARLHELHERGDRRRAFDDLGLHRRREEFERREDPVGGECDESKGWFIEPTVIDHDDPNFKSMCEEIFGPVLTIFVYDDDKLDETLGALRQASPYALTGAIFAQDRAPP